MEMHYYTDPSPCLTHSLCLLEEHLGMGSLQLPSALQATVSAPIRLALLVQLKVTTLPTVTLLLLMNRFSVLLMIGQLSEQERGQSAG